MKKNILLIISLIFTSTYSFANPLALIYKGPGSCVEDCSESPEKILKSMGYDTRFVGPNETNYDIFKNATLWLQPGGLVREQYKAMSPILKSNIVKFVKDGGGYIGLCAGALLASEGYYWDSSKTGPFVEMGLNFIPGYSTIYSVGLTKNLEYINVDIISTVWDGQTKFLYWEEGPVFSPIKKWKEQGVEVVSTYPNNYPATLRRKYFKGKVFVTAFHPEAPTDWLTFYKINDRDKDGIDFDVLKSMINWVVTK